MLGISQAACIGASAGWIAKIELTGTGDLDNLLDADAYTAYLATL